MKKYERLREMRESAALTPEGLCLEINLMPKSYVKYENGTRPMPSKALFALALFYGVSADYILGLTDEKTPYPRAK